MTLVRLSSRPVNKNFNILADAFLPHFASIIKQDFFTAAPTHSVPVNVKKTETDYQLEVIAPGFAKDDFTIKLEANLLTISGQKKEAAENNNEKKLRKEFTPTSFKRSFFVDDTINVDSICAKYVNGVLTLNFPIKEAVKPSTKEISVQ